MKRCDFLEGLGSQTLTDDQERLEALRGAIPHPADSELKNPTGATEPGKFLRHRQYPRLSLYFGVAGLSVQLLSGTLIYLLRSQDGAFMRALMGSRGMATAFILMGHASNTAFTLWLVSTSIFLIASFLSIVLLTRGTLNFTRIGSLFMVVLALLSAPASFGLVLGAVLMFASGIIGIGWAYGHTAHS